MAGQHSDIDHTGLPGVGGSGSEFTETSSATRASGDLSTTSTTFVDATDLTVTITTAAVRCLVLFTGTGRNSATGLTAVDLAIDGTRQGQNYGLTLVGHGASGNVSGNLSFTFLTSVLSAGSHTFKIQWRVDAGTGTLFANSLSTPAKITVLETSMTS